MMSRRAYVVGGALALAIAGAAFVAATIDVPELAVPNPLAETEVERPRPVLLTEVRDLNRHVAASGHFQTIVDVEQDADYLPDFLKGERVTLFAEGDVEAYVDFAGLRPEDVIVSPDGRSATITVPAPQLTEARLDHEHTYVATRSRGVIDRAGDALGRGDPVDDQPLYQRAGEQLGQAAEDSELRARAETNTRSFLESFVGQLGYDKVTVEFRPSSPPT